MRVLRGILMEYQFLGPIAFTDHVCALTLGKILAINMRARRETQDQNNAETSVDAI
jgi:hypothetical protein